MPRRSHPFEVGGFYHIFNRGVEKRDIVLSDADRRHFLRTTAFYQQVNTPTRLSLSSFEVHERQPPLRFVVHAYCVMDTHFHFLVEEKVEGGITNGFRHILDSYSRYFNRKYHRVGSLFQGRFKSVPVSSDEQFVHVARYIFLNFFVARLENRIGSSPWNGYQEYLKNPPYGLCDQSTLLSYFGSDPKKLQQFVDDHADYARSLAEIKDLVFE